MKKDNKFSQLKVLFKYLLVKSQKQNALNYRIEETVHSSNFCLVNAEFFENFAKTTDNTKK